MGRWLGNTKKVEEQPKFDPYESSEDEHNPDHGIAPGQPYEPSKFKGKYFESKEYEARKSID